MPSLSPQGPMNELLNAAAALVLLSLMLYAAVWLLQQIWVWLIILGGLALLITIAIWVVRWRRNRF